MRVALVVLALCVSAAATAQPATDARRAGEAYQAGRFEDAARSARAALSGGLSDPGLWTVRAVSLLQLGRIEAAEAEARAGLRAFPDAPPLLLTRADALLALDRPADALPLLLRLDRERPSSLGLPPAALAERIGRARLGLGLQAAREGRLPEAREALAAAVVALPDVPEAATALAFVLLESGDAAEAEHVATDALRQHPTAEGLLRAQLRARIARDDTEGVAESAGRLLDARPDDREAALIGGQALTRLGRRDEALAVYEAFLDRHADDPTAYEALADLNVRAGTPLGALAVRRRQQARLGESPELLASIGDLYTRAGQFDAARAAYDSVATLGGDAREAAASVARTYRADARWDEAAAATRRALDAGPDDVALLAALADDERRAGNPAGALDAARRWAALAPSADALVALADALAGVGRSEEAAGVYRQALSLDPPPPAAALGLGRLTGDAALLDRAARDALDAARTARQRLSAQVQADGVDTDRTEEAASIDALEDVAERALAVLAETDPTAAEATLRDLLAAYPRSGLLWLRLGVLLDGQGRTDDAGLAFAEAVRLAPGRLDVNHAAGAFFERTGRLQDAALAYERALGLNDRDPATYDALVRVYGALDQLDALLARWEARARTTAPNPVRADAIDRLRASR